MKIKKRPPRLPLIRKECFRPLYFVTINTWNRRKILACIEVYEAFMEYAERNKKYGRAIGKFVIMPDHLHFFVALEPESKLGDFVRFLKHSLTKVLKSKYEIENVWQPGFFDHLLRSTESYFEKWNYVAHNPERKELVKKAEDWQWQGEVVVIDRA